jgi:hypothetical protein
VAQRRGMAGSGRCSVRWGLRTREQAKEGEGECGDDRGCSSPFYRGWEEYGGAVPAKKRSPLMAAMMPAFRSC